MAGICKINVRTVPWISYHIHVKECDGITHPCPNNGGLIIESAPKPSKTRRPSSGDMATARINLKNIDYFKFKKLVIDANRDDYNACAKEVKYLCDDVQTLKFRDEEFDDESDRGRFAQICTYYKQILSSKRIDPTDVRIKSGWWGDHKNAYSAGKLKPGVLKDILVGKAKDWSVRHGEPKSTVDKIPSAIEGPGHYVFKHKDHQCFQFVGKADKIFSRCGEKLKTAYEGSSQDPLAALLIISTVTDWEFYIIPVNPDDDEKVLRILENDLILKHDSIWPHGLNFRLHIDSLLEVSEFRKSCLRHHWPPSSDPVSKTLDLGKLRRQVQAGDTEIPEPEPMEASTPKTKGKKPKPRPEWVGANEEDKENKENTEAKKAEDDKLIFIPFNGEEESNQQDDDAMSVRSSGTFTKDGPDTDLADVEEDLPENSESRGKPVIRRGSYTVSSPVVKKRGSTAGDETPKRVASPRPPKSDEPDIAVSRGKKGSRVRSSLELKGPKTTPNGTPKKGTPRRTPKSATTKSLDRHSFVSNDGEDRPSGGGSLESSTDTMERSTSDLSDEVKSEDGEGKGKGKVAETSRLPVATSVAPPGSPRR